MRPAGKHQPTRLLQALTLLVAEEEALVRADDTAALAGVQARIGAVLAKFTSNDAAAVAVVLEKREGTRRLLAARSAAVRGELERLRGAGRRLRGVAPAYGQAPAARKQRLLNTAV